MLKIWQNWGKIANYPPNAQQRAEPLPITGCFHDKTIISEENIRLVCDLQLKYCRKQCTLLPLPGSNHLQNLTPK